MKAILEGGILTGAEVDINPTTKKIAIPVKGKGGYGQLIYSRTDRREDGAVIFSCETGKLDPKGES